MEGTEPPKSLFPAIAALFPVDAVTLKPVETSPLKNAPSDFELTIPAGTGLTIPCVLKKAADGKWVAVLCEHVGCPLTEEQALEIVERVIGRPKVLETLWAGLQK